MKSAWFFLVVFFIVFAAQTSWPQSVDTAAAYMTVFGRTATPAEIAYWQNRLPATQAALVEISLNWLVSPSGAKDLKETVERGFQQAFSRQPTSTEQQEWENKIKASRWIYADFVVALKGKPSLIFVKPLLIAGSNVDTTAAYMTVFGRPATPAEIDYWKTRLPATQDQLVEINVNWLISSAGSKDRQESVARAFKDVFGIAPTPDDQAKWEARVIKSKLKYADLLSAMHNVPNAKLPPAFPVTMTAPTIYTCPIPMLAPLSNPGNSVSLSRVDARFGQGTISCDYTLTGDISLNVSGECPSTAEGLTIVVGPTPNTTARVGCDINAAWCHVGGNSGTLKSPSSGSCTYTGGLISIQHSVDLTCWGGPGVAGNHSPNGRFICW